MRYGKSCVTVINFPLLFSILIMYIYIGIFLYYRKKDSQNISEKNVSKFNFAKKLLFIIETQ